MGSPLSRARDARHQRISRRTILAVSLLSPIGCHRRGIPSVREVDCGPPVAGLQVLPVGLDRVGVCKGVVSATDGSYSEELDRRACILWGAFDRPGRYTLVARAPHFEPVTVSDIVVERAADGCHVVTQQVAVPLTDRRRLFPHGLSGMPEPVCEADLRPECWYYCRDATTETARCINPKVLFGELEISGPAPSDPRREILRLRKGFLSCYQLALLDSPDLRGSLKMAVEITPGAMPSAGIESTPGFDESFLACLQRSVQARILEPPEMGRARVVIPLTSDRE